ncbi:MAG: hypothetical protein U9P07_00520 [Pseudomonadota bacterium]|nr:hypothetical protein [Pseudomonadota bacterium]
MYAVAFGLKGFRSSSLRIRVERDLGDVVIARTADLLDAGTPLALDRSQVRPEMALKPQPCIARAWWPSPTRGGWL